MLSVYPIALIVTTLVFRVLATDVAFTEVIVIEVLLPDGRVPDVGETLNQGAEGVAVKFITELPVCGGLTRVQEFGPPTTVSRSPPLRADFGTNNCLNPAERVDVAGGGAGGSRTVVELLLQPRTIVETKENNKYARLEWRYTVYPSRSVGQCLTGTGVCQ